MFTVWNIKSTSFYMWIQVVPSMVVIDANIKCLCLLDINCEQEIRSASLRQHHAENNHFMENELIALFQ